MDEENIEHYSNREVDAQYRAIHDKLDELITHVKITNGSMLVLQKWQSFIMGGVAVLCIIVVPILLYMIYKMFQ